MYRDDVTHAWQSSENDANRSTSLAAAEISREGQMAIANATIEAGNAAALGNVASQFAGSKAGGNIIDKAFDAVTRFIFGD
jgi:hypothetical protein